jgi:hypothetical protein
VRELLIPNARVAAFVLINDERDRQLGLWGDGSISGDLSLSDKFLVLAEEVGEVAKAVNEYRADPSPKNYSALVDEITQVGACAVGMLESV